jgi:hypothetical protein
MRYLLGLVACLALSVLAKADVVTLSNTSTRSGSNTNTISITFTAAAGSSVSGFKLFDTSGSGSGQITASFFLDNSAGNVTKTSQNFDGTGYFFDLTSGWSNASGNNNLNLNANTYILQVSGSTGNYDVTSNSSISTASGSGLTAPSYLSSAPFNSPIARFEIYSVPEPGTLLLGGIAAACGGTGVWWKRRKRQPQPETTEQPAAI